MINNLVKLPGGVGDNTPTNQVDPNQLSIGVQVEMEHTNDHEIAQEIAMDHLTEDPQYYTKLIAAGLASEFQPSHNSGFGDPNQSFNDPSRIGHGGLKKGNMHGKIGNTSIGQVDGRNSEKKAVKRENQNQQILLYGLEPKQLQDLNLMFIQVLMLMDGQLDGINPKEAVGE